MTIKEKKQRIMRAYLAGKVTWVQTRKVLKEVEKQQ